MGASGRDRAAEGANLLAAIVRTVEKTPAAMAVGFDGRELSYGEFCLSNLAEYKHTCGVEFVGELPRTTTGKVRKFGFGSRG